MNNANSASRVANNANIRVIGRGIIRIISQ